MQGLRPSQSVRGINQKLLNLESNQDTVNGVRATLSKSQETTSRNIETLKTDLHDAVKKSTKNASVRSLFTRLTTGKNSSR